MYFICILTDKSAQIKYFVLLQAIVDVINPPKSENDVDGDGDDANSDDEYETEEEEDVDAEEEEGKHKITLIL